MVNQPLVSVLMTAYNREIYIAQAIESVIALTYKNWELIIVDDCSNDNTLRIAKVYSEKDARIRVFQNKNNLGDYPNRNKAAEYAKGKYLKYLDADDAIYFYGLDAMVYAMESNPEAAFGLSHSKTEESIPYPYMLKPESSYAEHFLGRGLFNYGPSGSIIKRSVFMEEGMFKTEQFLGDTEFWLRLGAKYPVVKMAPGLIWWRQHEGQQIVLEKRNYEVLAYRFMNDLNYLENQMCPLSIQDREKAIRRLKQNFARKTLSFLLKKDIKTVIRLLKISNLTFFELLKGFKKYE